MKRILNDITVLVSACGYQHMPTISKCLKDNGERNIKIVGTDMNDDDTIKQMVDVFYKVPKANDDNYIECVLDICKKEKVDIYIPVMSYELIPLINNIEKFHDIGVIVSISNRNSIEITNNKLKFYEFMKENDMPNVDFYSAKSVDDVKDSIKKLGYPNKAVCVKSLESSGSRGIRIIDSKKSKYDILFNEKPNSLYISYSELIDTLLEKKQIPNLVVMEAIPGDEFSVDLLADNGKILYMCARKSNSIVASIPQSATIFHDYEAYKICERVVDILKIDGNADFDFKYDANKKPILMEVNPRIAATMGIFKEAGVNLLYLRIKQLLGEELPAVDIKVGTRMVRRYLEMYSSNV